MSTVRKVLVFAVAWGMLCVAPALAQVEPRNTFGARSKAECPKETHPQALDPYKVECFAEFAETPIPRAPSSFVRTDPAELAALYEHGHELVRQLDQPGLCSKDTRLPRNSACALIIYTIDPAFRQSGVPLSEASYVGPWTYIVPVYRLGHAADLRNTKLWTINSNYSEGWYGPGQTYALWELTAAQRVAEHCKERGGTRSRASVASAGVVNGSCTRESEGPTFTPQLLVPCGGAHPLFTKERLDYYCHAPTYMIDDPAIAKLY